MTWNFSEPIGSKAPAVPTGVMVFQQHVPLLSTFSMLCQAQAFPVPVFR